MSFGVLQTLLDGLAAEARCYPVTPTPSSWVTPEPAPMLARTRVTPVTRELGDAVDQDVRQDLAEALAAAINRACDARGDDDANRAGLLAECAALPLDGQADMLAHFTIEAARWVAPDPDARVTCSACTHYRLSRCRNHRAAGLHGAEVGPDLAALPQHCPGFVARGDL